MIPLPPPDPHLPAMSRALDAEATRELLSVALRDCRAGRVDLIAAEPVYVRYKAATSCLVNYRLTIRDAATGVTDRIPAHLRLYADDHASLVWGSSALHRLVDRASRRHPGPLTGRAALVPDLNAILQVYTVDRALPQLVRVAQRSKAGRLLAEVTGASLPKLAVDRIDLVRYKPARKALLRYRLPADDCQAWGSETYVKAYADDRAGRLERVARRLRAQGVPIPAPLGALDEHRLGFQAAAEGVPLLAKRDDSSYAAMLDGVVDALARLHAVEPDTVVVDLPRVRPDHGARLLRQAADALATLLPTLAAEAHRLASELIHELKRAQPARLLPIHGDFYDDQVLVAGDQVTILDLDEVRLGDPLTDAGNFLGHVSAKLNDPERVRAAREAFLAAWATGSGRGDRRAPLLHEAVALMLLAVGPFRRLEASWPSAVAMHLELATKRLGAYRDARPVPGSGWGSRVPEDELLDLAAMGKVLSQLPLPVPVRVVGAEIVRHRSGRRTTVRYNLEVGPQGHQLPVYVKRFASARAPHVHAALGAVTMALQGARTPRVPEPLGCLPHEHLVLIGAVIGTPVVERLANRDTGLASAIADALHALHASGATLPRVHRLEDELAPLAERVERLAIAAPTLAADARQALAAVHARAAGDWTWRERPLHRDFYPDQVLVDDEVISFVDLDDAAMGEPAVDVANFVSHLRLLALRRAGRPDSLAAVEDAFLERSATLDPELDSALVRLLVGATCLRLAEIHVGRTRGPRLAHQLIEETRRCVPHPLPARMS